MIPIAKPIIGDEEKAAVLAVLESGQLAQGPMVAAFEEKFASMCGVREAVAVSSGTTALILALLAHEIGPGDEVITTPFSFIATANAVLFVGATPVFVDVRADDFNIDADLIEEKITPHTRAILPVHLYGYPCRMDRITEIAQRHGLAIIEDACQAHGASLNGRCVGGFGTGCFSFYPTKNLTTGEGGMITTNDPQIAVRARLLRDHGASTRYHHDILGYNWRMTDIAAALGLAQIAKLDTFTEARRANAAYLSAHLNGVITPIEARGYRHVYHQYTVRVPGDGSRDRLREHLHSHGVGSAVHYPLPIHQQPVYRERGYAVSLPVAEQLSREVLSLPVHPSLTQSDLDHICSAVNSFFTEGANGGA